MNKKMQHVLFLIGFSTFFCNSFLSHDDLVQVNETKIWTIYNFYKDWICTYKENDENLTYSKAVNIFAKSLCEIANKI